ncbi:MAG: hypothetical protein KGS47_12215 [Chloroflexi bacterium]|nr:hypothetical protein [Chloroflexota bacterium]
MSDESVVRARLTQLAGTVAQAQADATAVLPLALAELDHVRAAAHQDDARRRAEIAAGLDAARAAHAAARAALQAQLADLEAQLALQGNAAWDNPAWQRWAPLPRGSEPPRVVRVGEFCERVGGAEEWFPALVPLIGSASLCIIAPDAQKQASIAALQSVAMRVLAGNPPGTVRLTMIDPLGLGANAANFMALKDLDDELISARAWTEPSHIERQLADLAEHVENVVQLYLRTDFATIEAYNRSGGVRGDGAAAPGSVDDVNPIAEPYRIVVVFDFPTNFSEAAARRLVSLVQNGARCGVYALIHLDPGRKLPYGFDAAELTSHCQVITQRPDGVFWHDAVSDAQRSLARCAITLDALPNDIGRRIVEQVGSSSRSARGVSLPFDRIAPGAALWWQGAARGDGTRQGTAGGLRVGLGPAGARKIQQLELGAAGTNHHALVVGRIGSGKTTLLHTIITNLALTYAPDEIELYLIDFKEGVEFQVYARAALPHAAVVAIESEREFGLSVLRRLHKELERRSTEFRQPDVGVSNLREYRERTGKVMSRVLMIVDEFQVFFSDDDVIANEAARIIEDLVRRGRSFGLHLLFATQTLAGSATLSRATLDQFGVRIALQCSEADSRMILADDNGAARLLRRPGEAIYNDANGLIEGNTRFQVAYLGPKQLDGYLEALQRREWVRAERQIVFEGNRPALIAQNQPLLQVCQAPPAAVPPRRMSAWLGEPIEIKDPTAALFRRQRGSNLLIVGQQDELALGMLACSIVSIAAQVDHTAATFTIADFSDIDDERFGPYLEQLGDVVPQPLSYTRPRGLAASLQRLADELAERQAQSEQGLRARPSLFLVIFGLHRARDLQADDSGGLGVGSFSSFGSFGDTPPPPPSPAQLFPKLLRDGPDLGIHTIAWCDSVTNLTRILDRTLLREFETRVAMRMSADDSHALLGVPGAAKLPNLRALLVNEADGRQEKFRPYSAPANEWIARALDRHHRVVNP